ncbi:IS66 family transposase zinc-finger binding domain-containing protein [Methanocalculus sp.]|uniref:IS66 family transposase zinc-finger binding domain-containing protein n=1 Tax=Methanocalculus sp. TaxID=2004547 RepID=UPI001857B695|nr:hypothetical protein [Methanocalculus sp.]
MPVESVQKRQVHDIPPPQIIVIEHHAETVICPHCGQIHETSFPDDVPAHLQYGQTIRVLMVYLCIYHLLPMNVPQKSSQTSMDVLLSKQP